MVERNLDHLTLWATAWPPQKGQLRNMQRRLAKLRHMGFSWTKKKPSVTKPKRQQHPVSSASQTKTANILWFTWKEGNLMNWRVGLFLLVPVPYPKKSHYNQHARSSITDRLWAKPLDKSTISSSQFGPENQIYWWLTYLSYPHLPEKLQWTTRLVNMLITFSEWRHCFTFDPPTLLPDNSPG